MLQVLVVYDNSLLWLQWLSMQRDAAICPQNTGKRAPLESTKVTFKSGFTQRMVLPCNKISACMILYNTIHWTALANKTQTCNNMSEMKTEKEGVSSMNRRKTNLTTSTKVSESQTIIPYISRTSTESSLKGAYMHCRLQRGSKIAMNSQTSPTLTYVLWMVCKFATSSTMHSRMYQYSALHTLKREWVSSLLGGFYWARF